MAKIVRNPKGFKIIAMTPFEAAGNCSFGLVCDSCNCSLVHNKNVCYIAVLNSLYCPDCMKRFVYTNNLNDKDVFKELKNYTETLRKLNI